MHRSSIVPHVGMRWIQTMSFISKVVATSVSIETLKPLVNDINTIINIIYPAVFTKEILVK